MPVLKCGLCRRPIRGMTGLLELENLKKHMERVHQLPLTTAAALDLRIQFEDQAAYDEAAET